MEVVAPGLGSRGIRRHHFRLNLSLIVREALERSKNRPTGKIRRQRRSENIDFLNLPPDTHFVVRRLTAVLLLAAFAAMASGLLRYLHLQEHIAEAGLVAPHLDRNAVSAHHEARPASDYISLVSALTS